MANTSAVIAAGHAEIIPIVRRSTATPSISLCSRRFATPATHHGRFGVLSYFVTDDFSVGVRGRYWRCGPKRTAT